MSWPVTGTLMIEPTESEDLPELDRFCESMILVKQEIEDVASGKVEYADSPLHAAPHTMDMLMADDWAKPYR